MRRSIALLIALWDKVQDFGHSHWHNSLMWGENLDDVSITGPGLIHGKGYQGGGTAADAALEPEEKETEYPEPDMFGNIPAYGLYARHVKTLSARDVVFTLEKPDARPAFRFDSVAGVDLERLIVRRGSAPVFSLRSVTEFIHRNSPGLPDKRLAIVARDAF